MGKSTISMATFHCYVSSPEGNTDIIYVVNLQHVFFTSCRLKTPSYGMWDPKLARINRDAHASRQAEVRFALRALRRCPNTPTAYGTPHIVEFEVSARSAQQ